MPREEAPIHHVEPAVVATPTPPTKAVADSASSTPPSVLILDPPAAPAPVYQPMEWLTTGPSAGWFVDDPKRGLWDDLLAAPPSSSFCPIHGWGPCVPARLLTPTPSDEDPDHFLPPGYGPVELDYSPSSPASPATPPPAAAPS